MRPAGAAMWVPRVLAAAGLVTLVLVGGACGAADDPPESEVVTPTQEVTESPPSGGAAETEASAPTSPAARPEAIPASEPSIAAGDYEFTIASVVILDAVPYGGGLGAVPTEFTAEDRVVLVEFQLLAGNPEIFASEEILLVDSADLESQPFLVSAGGATTNLADTTLVESGAQYSPDPESTHSWAYAAPTAATGLGLVFPSGVVVDLEPLLQ